MALASRQALLEIISPLKNIKRYRAKINVQKPKQPHFEKAVYLALAKPWYINPKRGLHPVELCKKLEEKVKKEEGKNPLQKIIAEEVYDRFKSSKLIGFFHLNPMSSDEQFKAYVAYAKENMFFKQYGGKTLEMALKGTAYEVVLDFYVSHNILVFSPEPDIKKFLKVSKKYPQLVLIAGIYEGRLLSKEELMEYSKIPSLQVAQQGLVQILNSAGSKLVDQLNSHQSTLVSHLDQRIKQLEEEK